MKVERQERQTLIGKGKPDKVRELCQQGDLTFVQWQSPGHGDSLLSLQSVYAAPAVAQPVSSTCLIVYLAAGLVG